ncbi:hypothetical protein [Mycoplasmopsis bovis]|uniref:hypothetical protein n=1 Tax=Mycoplasmopsis bovis TaxID=28903 RepID=UPI00261A74E1|nr:hypothetical protein [Mycoplasmopsis bovis]
MEWVHRGEQGPTNFGIGWGQIIVEVRKMNRKVDKLNKYKLTQAQKSRYRTNSGKKVQGTGANSGKKV